MMKAVKAAFLAGLLIIGGCGGKVVLGANPSYESPYGYPWYCYDYPLCYDINEHYYPFIYYYPHPYAGQKKLEINKGAGALENAAGHEQEGGGQH